MEEKETVINGFCRSQNQGRRVFCVFVNDNGEWELDDVNCEYLKCQYKSGCDVGNQIQTHLRGEW